MDETLSYTVKQAVERTGYSRAWLYELLAAGKLQAKKDGRKTLILAHSLRNHLDSLPNYVSAAKAA